MGCTKSKEPPSTTPGQGYIDHSTNIVPAPAVAQANPPQAGQPNRQQTINSPTFVTVNPQNVAPLTQELQDAQNKLARTEAQLKATLEAKKDLETRFNALQASHKQTLTMLSQKDSEISRLQQFNRQPPGEIAQLQRANTQLTAKVAVLENTNQTQSAENRSLTAENSKLKREVSRLKRHSVELESEIESLKTDIDNFKIWTKKLDWSTTEQPTWLNKYFDIKQLQGVKAVSRDGTPYTSSGQQIGKKWHGPVDIVRFGNTVLAETRFFDGKEHGVRLSTASGNNPYQEERIYRMGKNLNRSIKKYDDGGRAYHCADENNAGVSVTVLQRKEHQDWCYDLKNGYKIELHTHKDLVCVRKVVEGAKPSIKWYQLKK